MVDFASVEDRDYYALKDPFHAEVAKAMGSYVEEAHVVDFADQVFS